MEARVTLRPGKRGTIKWLNQYGEDSFACAIVTIPLGAAG